MLPILVFENVRKSYSGQLILNDVNIEIFKGEKLAIVGPSGSGKTTFLNIAGALDVPDAGKVFFNKSDISKLSEVERSIFRNNNIGFVFQHHYLLPQCTVLENALLPTLTYKNKSDLKAARNRALVLLEKLGMSAHLHKLPSQLSGGECQRTAFARALINQPELILADEPTGSLDEENADILVAELVRLNTEFNTSLVVVTHSEKIASKMECVLHLKHHSFEKNE